MSLAMSKPVQVERAAPLSISMLVAGIAMVIAAILAMYDVAFTEMGNWDWWVLIIGALAAVVGGIWLASYVMNVRKFRKLIAEPSKAAFIKELDDLEYLAWRLPMKFENELMAKKKHFGLK
jgi:uncharacterized integral membrane protein